MKSLSDFELNKENPFVRHAIVQIGQALVSRKTSSANKDEQAILKATDHNGQILGNTIFMRSKVVDSEQFTKFYFRSFRAFYDLKPASIRVFGFILSVIKADVDSFSFYIEDCMKETKYSKTTIYRCLAELCRAEIIARGRNEYEYYINPMVIFNGDRVTFATTYINKNYPEYKTSSSRLKGTIKQMTDDRVLPPFQGQPLTESEARNVQKYGHAYPTLGDVCDAETSEPGD